MFYTAGPRAKANTAHCKWCSKKARKRDMFKTRDGPIEWYFCNIEHARDWVENRHKPHTYKLCKMLPLERAQYLKGRTMAEEISQVPK